MTVRRYSIRSSRHMTISRHSSDMTRIAEMISLRSSRLVAARTGSHDCAKVNDQRRSIRTGTPQLDWIWMTMTNQISFHYLLISRILHVRTDRETTDMVWTGGTDSGSLTRWHFDRSFAACLDT